jgi:hypothetical protein
MSLATIRAQLATITRDGHPDPPHGSDGRFYSGGSAGSGGDKELGFAWGHPPTPSAADLTPEQAARAQAAINPNGATTQCSYCTKMLSGPLTGRRLGFQLPAALVHINDGLCPDCERRTYIQYFRSKGLSAKEARRRAEAFMQSKADRLATVRALLAEVQRNYTVQTKDGRTWEYVQGSNGRVTNIVLVSSPGGKAHGGIAGVTHVSHHEEGMSGGGAKSRVTNEDIYAARAAFEHANETYQQQLQMHSGDSRSPDVMQAYREYAAAFLAFDKIQQQYALQNRQPHMIDANLLNPYKPADPKVLQYMFGDKAVAGRLADYSTTKLNEIADTYGVKVDGIRTNHDALVDALTQHATDGREGYPHDGSKGKSSTAASPITPLSQEEIARIYGPEKRSIFESPLVPIAHVDNHFINPEAPPDPHFLNTLYGPGQLHEALAEFSHSELLRSIDELQRNGYDVQPGRTKEATIQELMRVAPHADLGDQMKRNYLSGAEFSKQHASWIRVAAKGDRIARGTTTAPKAAKPVTDTVPRAMHDKLREAHEQLKAAHADLKQQLAQQQREMTRQQKAHDTEKARMQAQLDKLAGVKTTKSGGGKATKSAPTEIIKPVRQLASAHSKSWDITKGEFSANEIRTMYGHDQFAKALNRYSSSQLSKIPGIIKGKSKEDTIARTVAHYEGLPYEPSNPITQRLSLATIRHSLHAIAA